jgi:hypothetical protein
MPSSARNYPPHIKFFSLDGQSRAVLTVLHLLVLSYICYSLLSFCLASTVVAVTVYTIHGDIDIRNGYHLVLVLVIDNILKSFERSFDYY